MMGDRSQPTVASADTVGSLPIKKQGEKGEGKK